MKFSSKKIVEEHREYWNHITKEYSEKDKNILEAYFFYLYSSDSPLKNISYKEKEVAIAKLIEIEKPELESLLQRSEEVLEMFRKMCFTQEERIQQGITKRIDELMELYSRESASLDKMGEELVKVKNLNELIKTKDEIEKKIIKESMSKTKGNKKPSVLEAGHI